MSCLGKKYLPIPPREWNRFQNICSQPDSPNISLEEAYRLQMIRKGNILQYKTNSAQLTKKEKYWQLVNRKYISWANQTETMSNPNTGLFVMMLISNICGEIFKAQSG